MGHVVSVTLMQVVRHPVTQENTVVCSTIHGIRVTLKQQVVLSALHLIEVSCWTD